MTQTTLSVPPAVGQAIVLHYAPNRVDGDPDIPVTVVEHFTGGDFDVVDTAGEIWTVMHSEIERRIVVVQS